MHVGECHQAPWGRPVERTGPRTDLGHRPGIPRGAFPAQTTPALPPLIPPPPWAQTFLGAAGCQPSPPSPCRGGAGQGGGQVLWLGGHGESGAQQMRRRVSPWGERKNGEAFWGASLHPSPVGPGSTQPRCAMRPTPSAAPNPRVHLCRQPASVPNHYRTASTTLCTSAPARVCQPGTAHTPHTVPQPCLPGPPCTHGHHVHPEWAPARCEPPNTVRFPIALSQPCAGLSPQPNAHTSAPPT